RGTFHGRFMRRRAVGVWVARGFPTFSGFLRWVRSSATGCPAPRMSPGVATPPLLLYFATPDTRSPTTSLALGRLVRHRVCCSRPLGALRSEIKEEDRAKPGPGDIRGARHP